MYIHTCPADYPCQLQLCTGPPPWHSSSSAPAAAARPLAAETSPCASGQTWRDGGVEVESEIETLVHTVCALLNIVMDRNILTGTLFGKLLENDQVICQPHCYMYIFLAILYIDQENLHH